MAGRTRTASTLLQQKIPQRLYGATEVEIRGKTDYDFVTKELADFFREKDKAAIAAGRPTINEEAVVYADDGYSEILRRSKHRFSMRATS